MVKFSEKSKQLQTKGTYLNNDMHFVPFEDHRVSLLFMCAIYFDNPYPMSISISLFLDKNKHSKERTGL